MFPRLASDQVAVLQVIGPADIAVESSSSSSSSASSSSQSVSSSSSSPSETSNSSSSSSAAAGAPDTGWVNAGNYHLYLAIISLGENSGTLDASIQQATGSAGFGQKAITSKSITQLTSSDSDVQALINLRPDELDVSNGFSYIRLFVTATDGAYHGVLLGIDPRHSPASQNDVSTVTEIVS